MLGKWGRAGPSCSSSPVIRQIVMQNPACWCIFDQKMCCMGLFAVTISSPCNKMDLAISQRIMSEVGEKFFTLTLSQGRGCDRHQLLNWLFCVCDDPRSATAPLLSPLRVHGTVCLIHCTDCHHWHISRNFWKLIYLKSHLRNRTVCDCKALLKRLVLPTALYKLFT